MSQVARVPVDQYTYSVIACKYDQHSSIPVANRNSVVEVSHDANAMEKVESEVSEP
jgi:hypothetical protein